MSDQIGSYPPGSPAITPSKIVSGTQVVSGTQITLGTQPAFTQTDVEQFLGEHPLFAVMSPAAGKVSKVLFIPAKQASDQLNGESIGRPDGALVCWVEVQGPLDPSAMASVPDIGHIKLGVAKPAQRGILIFDALTGNFLLRTWQGF